MILVTGANGFVGSELCRTLAQRGLPVRGAVRREARGNQVEVGALDGATDWSGALAGCDTVIHLAARVHVMHDQDRDPLRAYREVNVEASLNLARQAQARGVKRLVFVSSIKVNGERTEPGQAFRASDRPAPCDPYGQSKMEAEQLLLQLGRDSGMQVVIVRPPLVYGPGVKANFLNLVKLVARGWPLPFGSVAGRRSMVALDNLVDLLIVCASHPRAPGQIFLASDDADLAVPELVRLIAAALGKPARLVPVPVGLMYGTARLLGKAALADRLLGSLQVDIAHTKALLEWSPVVTPQASVEKTVAAFFNSTRP